MATRHVAGPYCRCAVCEATGCGAFSHRRRTTDFHKAINDPSDPMNRPSPPSAVERLTDALQAILAEPYGCAFCDSGTLRNPNKEHTAECGFAKARAALAASSPHDEKSP